MRRSVRIDEIANLSYGKLPPKKKLETPGFPIFTGYRVSGFAEEFLYDEEQVVVVARGVGGTGNARLSPRQSWITNLCIVLEVDTSITDKRFLVELLDSQSLKQKLDSGSAQSQITIQSLAPYHIQLPDLSIQRRIADILSAYDDLIENNNRRMALLEESIHLLYREWFVSLRFPGRERVEIVDGVPEGWSLGTLPDITSEITRGVPPKYDDESVERAINQRCIRGGRINLELARRHRSKVNETKRVRQWDVLVNSTGVGTLGRVAQVAFAPERLTVDTHVTILRPSQAVNSIWFGAAMADQEPTFTRLGQGATGQTELRRKDLQKVRQLVPTSRVQGDFAALILPFRAQVEALDSQNQKLREARDLLLPRLMDGRIPV